MGVGRVMGKTCVDCKGSGLKRDSHFYGKTERYKTGFGLMVVLVICLSVFLLSKMFGCN
jgi:hypothetical protein